MSQFFQSALRSFGYLLSLPERTVRSMAAVAGGTTSLLTEALFPESLRGTTLYKVFVGDAQRFMITQIAQVQRERSGERQPVASALDSVFPQATMPVAGLTGEMPASQQPTPLAESTGETPVPPEALLSTRGESSPACVPTPTATTDDPRYIQRKLVGSALETAGLFAMHVSPLWVFALAGDAAAGSSVFLQRLVNQLEKNDVIPPGVQVTGVADLLAAIHETSRKGAAAVDTPPLSREELTQLADDMIAQSRQVFAKATDLLPRMETIWATMQHVADRQNISLDALSGILTIDVTAWARKGVGAVMAVGQTGSDLVGEGILDSYAATLKQVSEQGVTQYVSQHLSPFLSKAWSHLDPEHRTWTESLMPWDHAERSAE